MYCVVGIDFFILAMKYVGRKVGKLNRQSLEAVTRFGVGKAGELNIQSLGMGEPKQVNSIDRY